jgi:hypothetical protein
MHRRDFTLVVAAMPDALTQHVAADKQEPMVAVAVDVVATRVLAGTGGEN